MAITQSFLDWINAISYSDWPTSARASNVQKWAQIWVPFIFSFFTSSLCLYWYLSDSILNGRCVFLLFDHKVDCSRSTQTLVVRYPTGNSAERQTYIEKKEKEISCLPLLFANPHVCTRWTYYLIYETCIEIAIGGSIVVLGSTSGSVGDEEAVDSFRERDKVSVYTHSSIYITRESSP